MMYIWKKKGLALTKKNPKEVGGSTKLCEEKELLYFGLKTATLAHISTFANSDHILLWMDTDSFMVCDWQTKNKMKYKLLS